MQHYDHAIKWHETMHTNIKTILIAKQRKIIAHHYKKKTYKNIKTRTWRVLIWGGKITTFDQSCKNNFQKNTRLIWNFVLIYTARNFALYMMTTPTRTIIYWNNLNYHLWRSEGWEPWQWKPTELYTKPVLFLYMIL